jgi:4-amino-4-deoxy-L-arabinose transferase-like glycosyltransferase
MNACQRQADAVHRAMIGVVSLTNSRGTLCARSGYLVFAVLAGALVVTTTEALSAFHALTRAGAMVAFMMIIAAGAVVIVRLRPRIFWRVGWIDTLLIAGIAGVLSIVAFVAILSPPNSSDAMAYHLPRVLYWAQQHSVAFFATPYLNQIMLQPFAEYCMLHLYLLAGDDRLVNLAQWFGCATSVVGVSLIARHFGAGRRGQILAALFCATLPNGILQASGAKNDYLMAAWLVAAVWLLLEGESIAPYSPVLAGLALGLAIGTKATAYLYLPAVLVAVLILTRWSVRSLLIVAFCAVMLNLPQFARNIDLSGSPLGFDSAFGDGKFRWRNETFGWKQTASNLIRNSTEQLGARSEPWNQWLYTTAVSLHHRMDINVDDPAGTWLWSEYRAPRNTNHEADAGNRWHLLILAVCFLILPWRSTRLLLYAGSLVAGFVLFCFYLKWQPSMARMFLPLFVLASPIAGVLGEQIRPAILQVALCLFLLNNARPYLFENWVRPLKGPRSLLDTSRDQNYFADMTQWNNRESYFAAADAIAKLNCSPLGIDINNLQLEYPIQALLRERNPAIQFVHTGVSGPAAKYARPEKPCAVLCLDCAGDPARSAEYREYGPVQPIGKFLLFVRP